MREFREVATKLSTIRSRPEGIKWGRHLDAAFVVLAYADPIAPSTRATFGGIYDSLAAHDEVQSVTAIVERAPVGEEALFTCKLLEVALATGPPDEATRHP